MLTLSSMPLSKMKLTELTSVSDSLLAFAAESTTTVLFLETASLTEIRNKRINWMKPRIQWSGGKNGLTMVGQKQ